jgi:hypothetical protein
MATALETANVPYAICQAKHALAVWRSIASDHNFGAEYCKAAELAAQQFAEIVELLNKSTND